MPIDTLGVRGDFFDFYGSKEQKKVKNPCSRGFMEVIKIMLCTINRILLVCWFRGL